jgi:hypothetical protein
MTEPLQLSYKVTLTGWMDSLPLKCLGGRFGSLKPWFKAEYLYFYNKKKNPCLLCENKEYCITFLLRCVEARQFDEEVRNIFLERVVQK